MIKAKDIQRIIAANETAQEASISIKEMVDNYVEQQLKNCNIQNVNQQRELLIAYTQYIFEQIGSENSSLTENMIDGFLGN